jgi:predicted MFS family arabinose efflux permease
MTDPKSSWDTSYEWKAVALLSFGFGLVGLDRWIIAPLFPFMMNDLGLGYQAMGNLIAVLGLFWGVSAVSIGALADRIGRRKILIPAILVFSLLSGLSGIATGIGSLLLIRAIMGVTEGSFCPASVAATADASAPKRRGLNQGIQLSCFALFGLGFGPIVATQLLRVVPSWRWVFVMVAIPGLITAFLLYAVIREPAHVRQKSTVEHRWAEILRSRNVLLAMGALMCSMTGVFVLSAMMPNYLLDYLHISPEQMGFVMSAIGFGGFAGNFGVAGISDLWGRKITAILSFAGASIMMIAFIVSGAHPVQLFVLLFLTSFFCFGLLALFTGPIATEAVHVTLISSAIGIVSSTGEIFGGGVAPSLAGYIAQHYGIQNTLLLALGGLVAGIFVCLFLKETAPTMISRQTMKSLAATELPVER